MFAALHEYMIFTVSELGKTIASQRERKEGKIH
jgi:hypothetical protein